MASRRSSSSAAAIASVDEFLRVLDHPHKEGIELLRAVILTVDKRITEEIKWNAPSFKLTDHFATFKLHPPKGIQLVLHVGSRPIVPPKQFQLDVPVDLVKWAAPDRCILMVPSSSAAAALQSTFARAVKQWLSQL